ncbi:SWIM zinc finger family protein [Rhodococcus sp. NPDC003318]|uniref:SWIM zinc finger family protein n=1 Tax=Rhodococcus sp. NPDC003318 TaxID=3364503 RepID=UPI0036A2DA0E
MSSRSVPRRSAGSGWGRSLLSALERSVEGARLGRGSAHVRAGQVLAVRTAPGLVVGEVQGSQNEPFTATFTLRRLDPDAIEELIERVRTSPGMLATIASGSLPAELGALLLPADSTDIDFGCTCPDQGWPCRHAAALVTVTAQRLDSDPTLLLALRGVDLDALIRGVEESPDAPTDPGDWFGGATELPALPRPAYVPATQDLNPVHLRAALRGSVTDPAEVAQALRDLDGLYRALTGE